MSSALTLILYFTCITVILAGKEKSTCPGKHSVWDKWYDGCNWCVCTESGPICTDKSCYRIPVDQCETPGQKWRDGCYRCHCKESGIVCIADHRCVHAMRYRPFPCKARLGCVCGLDGLSSCIADNKQMESADGGYYKTHQDDRYVSNRPHWSTDRYIALTQKMTCDDEKRWYSGSKRCFCATGQQEAECGDPRYIAHRLDGFRFKISQCYTGQTWDYNCRTCTCHMYGFGFCVRIPDCKRNNTWQNNRHVSLREECRPGSQWRDGCQICKCSSDNRIVCDSSGCNLSGNMGKTEVKVHVPNIVVGEAEVRIIGKGVNKPEEKEATRDLPGAVDDTIISRAPRFQIPPPNSFNNMIRSYRKSKELTLTAPVRCLGKYKPGETFYDKCNYCTCTEAGIPMCTAILCVK